MVHISDRFQVQSVLEVLAHALALESDGQDRARHREDAFNLFALIVLAAVELVRPDFFAGHIHAGPFGREGAHGYSGGCSVVPPTFTLRDSNPNERISHWRTHDPHARSNRRNGAFVAAADTHVAIAYRS